MTNVWADSTRMPWLPGLSDAGHCREWDAGVPIDLDAIRDKDEDYWMNGVAHQSLCFTEQSAGNVGKPVWGLHSSEVSGRFI
jgi:hypothetical protein